MGSSGDSACIDTAASLQDFFHQEILEVVDRHHIDGEQDTVWYLTRLLCRYGQSRQFFDQREDNATLTPLADYYRHAIEASSNHERRLHLQRLGDVALFISSLFAGALKRKPVNVNYYIAMGESAYGSLADATARTPRDRGLVDIFADLAQRFPDYVAALADIPARPADPASLMQQVLEWEQTGHPALARRLRLQGVFLSDTKADTDQPMAASARAH